MRALAILLLLVALSPHVRAQTPLAATPAAPPTPATLTPAQAQSVLDVLQDDAKRAAFTAVLENMVHAIPPPPAQPSAVQIAADSLGARLLEQVSESVSQMAEQFTAATEAVDDTPLVWNWMTSVADDPTARRRLLHAGWRLAVVLICALAGEWLVGRALRRPRRALEARAPHDESSNGDPSNGIPSNGDPDDVPDTRHDGISAAEAGETELRARHRRFSVAWRMLRRLPFVVGGLLLNLLPVAAFAAISNGLLGTPLGDARNARLVVLAVVYAYVICRVIMCVTRMFVSPDSPRLRLVQCTTETAAYVERWMRRLAVVAVFGFTLAEVGLLFGLYRSAHDALLKLVGLVVHVMLVVIVLQKRRAIEQRLRPRRRSSGMLATLQTQIAARWHYAAIFYIVALWLVAAAEIKDGYARLLHFFVITVSILIAARLISIVLLGGLDRGLHYVAADLPALQQRLDRYFPILRATLSFLLTVATLVVLLQFWGFDPIGWFSEGGLGGSLLSALITSAITVGLAAAIWEAANASVENHLAGLTRQAQNARAARLRTLLPMLRTALLVSILIITGLIVLSQVGVNIAPLLAGAGVLGVAIGFGSQKLVQDLITGLFLLLENTMQVGDIVLLAGLTGTVENLSIRTIRLRATDGSVHIIPFSSVSTVTNQTRDFSYALIDLPVGLNEEPDRIGDLLRDIVKTMRAEPRWQDSITSDAEIQGVNAFNDNNWIMRIRIRTTPSQRWAVNREFNRRVKYRFDELAIQSPMTAYKVQGWLPPGAERPAPQPEPAVALASEETTVP
jgi:moderate conductance mechanosensitive channel